MVSRVRMPPPSSMGMDRALRRRRMESRFWGRDEGAVQVHHVEQPGTGGLPLRPMAAGVVAVHRLLVSPPLDQADTAAAPDMNGRKNNHPVIVPEIARTDKAWGLRETTWGLRTWVVDRYQHSFLRQDGPGQDIGALPWRKRAGRENHI